MKIFYFCSVRAAQNTQGLILDDRGSLKPGEVVLGVGWLRTVRARVRVFTGG